MTVTTDRQAEYRGLLLTDPYHLRVIEGLLDMPEVRTADRPLLLRHGLHPGTDYLAGRSLLVQVDVVHHDETTFYDAVAELRAAFQVGSEAPLTFQLPGVADGELARIYARCRAFKAVIDDAYWEKAARVAIRLDATDPRIYADDESSDSTSLPDSVGGLTFPLTFPLSFGGVVSSGGRITAVNAGSFPAPWVARIDGPVNDPRIEHVGTGQKIDLELAVDAGDYVLLDSATRSVLLNGTASRYSALTTDSTWFELAPGSNELAFRAAVSSAATVTVSWRSAWT